MSTTADLHPIFTERQIRAVAFDLHDTLVAYPDFRAFLTDALPRHAPDQDLPAVAETWFREMGTEPPWPITPPYPLFRSYREIWVRRLRVAGLPEHPARALVADWADTVAAAPLVDGAETVITALAARAPVAIVSNGDADYVQAAVERTGLHRLPLTVIATTTLTALKPARTVFRHLARSLNTDPAHILVVGDNPRTDIAGARAAGMVPVWVPRPGDIWREAAAPPLTLTRLRDLLGGASATTHSL